MTTPLELSARRDANGVMVLTAAGEIDMSNAAGFRDALSQAGADDAAFIVDLTGVDYLDSAGPDGAAALRVPRQDHRHGRPRAGALGHRP